MNRCHLDPECTFPPHTAAEHPCGVRHIPGSPCRFCGKPTPLDGNPCPDCWSPITIADFRALMATEGFDTTVRPA